MNYQNHYKNLIRKAQKRPIPETYTERHHIIPRCMGGNNDAHNIAVLTAEEHYVAHQLLVKIYPEEPKLVYAVQRMIHSSSNHVRNNKMYGWIRKKLSRALSERMTGKGNSMYGRTGEKCPSFGRTGKKSAWGGKTGERAPRFGTHHTPESKKKTSESLSKIWWSLISPKGERFRIKNLNQFCREHGLSAGNMNSVAQGKHKHHKGWKCKYSNKQCES